MVNKLNYTYDVNLKDQTTATFILELCGTNKEILELGAGPGSITKLLINNAQCEVSAIEISDDFITSLKHFCKNVYKLNLNDDKWHFELKNNKFDIVLAADVLEHLYDPLAALKSMRKLLKPNGSIIVSLPHIGHASVFACLIDNDFEYKEWGLLDQTHIRFFGVKNIQKLFKDADLSIVNARFVMRKPEYTEYSEKWAKLSKDARLIINQNKFSEVYQVIIEAIPSERSLNSLDLLSQPIHKSPFSLGREVNRILKQYLPTPIQQFVRTTYLKLFRNKS